jgi:hypothetical protein
MNQPDPFADLGMPASPDLTDEQVRAAWRTIATATHPDRPDGGDQARYAAASAAYAVLRTAWGRSEAYADLAAATTPPALLIRITPQATAPAAQPRLSPWQAIALLPARIRHGRPGASRPGSPPPSCWPSWSPIPERTSRPSPG